MCIYGKHLKLSLFGQSHGPAIGMTLHGIPAGLPVDLDALQAFLDRRRPGDPLASGRKEADISQFLAGIVNGYTCGAPICAVIYNQDAQSSDYAAFQGRPRPGHADYTAQVKYRGYQDAAGGGHFSGRLTAPLCIAGGLCKQWLAPKNITFAASLSSVGSVTDPALFADTIASAKATGDSIGGTVSCTVSGLPAGIGGPWFESLRSGLGQILFAIPGVTGVEFGDGFASALRFGSENNDLFTVKNGNIQTISNHCGGIQGGISNGMDITFRVAFKPTASIAKAQKTIDLSTMKEEVLHIAGRHDPCIALRAAAVVEAAAAIAIFDSLLIQKGDTYGA